MVSRALAVALFCVAFAATAAERRELIHPYPEVGPVEVAGPPATGRSMRAVQRMTMPPFTDVLATHVANALRGASDEPMAVVRKSRQSGNEAVDAVAKATGDGNTLLLAMNAPTLRGIARVAVMPYVFVVRSESPYRDVAELMALLKTSSTRFLAASAGERTVAHTALAMLRSQHGIRAEPVAYRGGYAALQALSTKEVSVALVPLPSVTPYASAGRLRVLPAGNATDIVVTDAFHVFAPKDTPNITVARINTALASNLVTPDAQALFTSLGIRLDHRSAGRP